MSRRLKFYRAIIIILFIALFQIILFTRLSDIHFLGALMGLFAALITIALMLLVLMRSLQGVRYLKSLKEKAPLILLGIIINAAVLYIMFVLTFNYIHIIWQRF